MKFVTEYLKDGNGRQAVIRAGYSARGADTAAVRLLKKPPIRAALAKARAKAESQAAAQIVPWLNLVPEVQQTLRDVASGLVTKGGATRALAAEKILDRALGKPTTKVQLGGDGNEPASLTVRFVPVTSST